MTVLLTIAATVFLLSAQLVLHQRHTTAAKARIAPKD